MGSRRLGTSAMSEGFSVNRHKKLGALGKSKQEGSRRLKKDDKEIWGIVIVE